jgi:hypothetical protein
MMVMSVLVISAGVMAFAQNPLPDSDCLNTGNWLCERQGLRLCNYGPGSCTSHTCYICAGGPTSLPAKMCFMVEGGPGCTPGSTAVICSYKWPNASCIVEQGTNACICTSSAQPNGQCNFTSCDD